MRIKELFTVPDGKRVTEKVFGRVLISSICSILLCMACLAGTTWAWFAVSIENTGNVIQIGKADVKVTVNSSTEVAEVDAKLPTGNCSITIENGNSPDEFDRKATLYVTLHFNGQAAGYVILSDGNEYKTTVNGQVGNVDELSWSASWFEPDGVDLLGDGFNLTDEAESSKLSEETAATEVSTETTSVDSTTESKEGTEPTGEQETTATE